MAFLLLMLASTVVAGDKFSQSCANYYFGNGISDGTGELFLEAFCHGGQSNDGIQRPGRCSRLKLADCFQNLNGALRPKDNNEFFFNEIFETCDPSSCAMTGDAWDGPELTCTCQNLDGEWDETSIDLDIYIGNAGGYLECGSGVLRSVGTTDCLYPDEITVVENELR